MCVQKQDPQLIYFPFLTPMMATTIVKATPDEFNCLINIVTDFSTLTVSIRRQPATKRKRVFVLFSDENIFITKIEKNDFRTYYFQIYQKT